MYVLLTGAFKNAGDYLIANRAKELLKEFRRDREVIEINRLNDLNQHIDVINRSKALILCGGPALAADFYPNIYPLTTNINDIKVPIIPMGVGLPMGLGFSKSNINVDNFTFTNTSQLLLRDIHAKANYSGCRDVLTERALNNHGFANVLMTGCPAWYHIPSFGVRYTYKPIEKIAFSTGAFTKLFGQNIEIMKELKRIYPSAKFYSVFHRGIGPGERTGIEEGLALQQLAEQSEEIGYEVIDASFGMEKLDIYHEVDLHVGYRVHAHILMLSIRKPSFLIQEDGRGLGVSLSLNMANDAWAHDPDLVTQITSNIESENSRNFDGFADIGDKIDNSFQSMRKFLESLP